MMKLKFSLDEEEMLKDPMLMLEQNDKFDNSIEQLEFDLLNERKKGTNEKLRKI